MIIHKIHDLSNSQITKLLIDTFGKITDDKLVENYHPDFKDKPSNVFYILEKKDRYKNGAYYVLEDNNGFVLSTGWNPYEHEENVALLLTRTYISEKYRSKLLMQKYLLPDMINDSSNYIHKYITFNLHNMKIYNNFLRLFGKKTVTNKDLDIYRKFIPIGVKNIYFTPQYVLEYFDNHESYHQQSY